MTKETNNRMENKGNLYSSDKCSFLFLLSAMGINDKMKGNGFVDCYLKDKNREHDSDSHLLYALFKPDSTFLFEKMLDALEDIILDEYDYSDGYVVVVFKFPRKWDRDWNLIMEGKYSRVSQDYKNQFPEVTLVDGVPPIEYPGWQRMVFDKNKILLESIFNDLGVDLSEHPDAQVFGKFNMDKEILNIE